MSEEPGLQVVATAGHVDHGKSSLIVRLTGIDPDRWEEEKRRGLTIDLGFAWTTLPSGWEIGFVDVPGHERFVRNMLAGVGPVRLVLFVVAADEGWKPQSEEHLAILAVLGVGGGVVALTKSDLVNAETLATREAEVRAKLEGTPLASAAIVPCSSETGEGLDALREALDAMVIATPVPEDEGRPRIHIDRAFTIRGAGTVVTGTLTGGSLRVGEEVELYPSAGRARIRSLQTHHRPVEIARAVSRVAANLAATSKEQVERGDVLGLPGRWRPTSDLEVRIEPVRGLTHPLTARGAYKAYAGAAERDARLRLYDVDSLQPGETAFARLRLARPVVVEPGDRFVLREAGRRATVAGGTILDAHPPTRPGTRAGARLERRASMSRGDLPAVIVAERGAVRAGDLPPLTGASPATMEGAERIGEWWLTRPSIDQLTEAATRILAEHHREHPLQAGMETGPLRLQLMEEVPTLTSPLEAGLAEALLARLEDDGRLVRSGTELRLEGHRVSLGEREPDAERLLKHVRDGETTPPDTTELGALGFDSELIEAVCSTGRLVRLSPEIVVSPELAARAEAVAREEASRPEGLTVSRFRQALDTTRKYALPLLAWLDTRGVTIRRGDVRILKRSR